MRIRGKGNLSKAKLNPKEAKLQGSAMMVRRVLANETQREIALLFGLSEGTVKKRLAEAHSAELQNLAADILTERCLPKAIALLDSELEKGNYEAAKDILYGLQVLQKSGKATMTHNVTITPTLDQIRKERQKTIDGEVTEVKPDVDPKG